MIAEITTEGNSPTIFDRHHQGNSHAVDFRDAIAKLLSCFCKGKKIVKYNNESYQMVGDYLNFVLLLRKKKFIVFIPSFNSAL